MSLVHLRLYFSGKTGKSLFHFFVQILRSTLLLFANNFKASFFFTQKPFSCRLQRLNLLAGFSPAFVFVLSAQRIKRTCSSAPTLKQLRVTS